MLETPEEVRELQRKLYQKAKQEKGFRFCLLYDKVYRRDILSHAYRLVRANQGAPGVDGETFEEIEKREEGAERYSDCESRWKKMIGKPYSGKPNVRFDEGELEIGQKPLRQLSTLPLVLFQVPGQVELGPSLRKQRGEN